MINAANTIIPNHASSTRLPLHISHFHPSSSLGRAKPFLSHLHISTANQPLRLTYRRRTTTSVYLPPPTDSFSSPIAHQFSNRQLVEREIRIGSRADIILRSVDGKFAGISSCIFRRVACLWLLLSIVYGLLLSDLHLVVHTGQVLIWRKSLRK